MNYWQKTGRDLVVSALFFVVILRVTGELHPSSPALEFFAILWVVQAVMALLQGWRRPQEAAAGGARASERDGALGERRHHLVAGAVGVDTVVREGGR